MNTIIPVWTDSGDTIIAAQGLTKGNYVRGTIDLRQCAGGYVTCAIWKYGTTGFTTGVAPKFRISPMINGGSIETPVESYILECETAPAVTPLVNNASHYGIGTDIIAYDGTGNPSTNDMVCFTELATPPANGVALTGWELARAGLGGTTPLKITAPTKKTHNDNLIISNKASCWRVPLYAGCVWEVVADYLGETAAPEAVGVVAYKTTYEWDLVT